MCVCCYMCIYIYIYMHTCMCTLSKRSQKDIRYPRFSLFTLLFPGQVSMQGLRSSLHPSSHLWVGSQHVQWSQLVCSHHSGTEVTGADMIMLGLLCGDSGLILQLLNKCLDAQRHVLCLCVCIYQPLAPMIMNIKNVSYSPLSLVPCLGQKLSRPEIQFFGPEKDSFPLMNLYCHCDTNICTFILCYG